MESAVEALPRLMAISYWVARFERGESQSKQRCGKGLTYPCLVRQESVR
jgi:hypothetical protein